MAGNHHGEGVSFGAAAAAEEGSFHACPEICRRATLIHLRNCHVINKAAQRRLPRMNQKYSAPRGPTWALWGDGFTHGVTTGHPKAVQETCARTTSRVGEKSPAPSCPGRGLRIPPDPAEGGVTVPIQRQRAVAGSAGLGDHATHGPTTYRPKEGSCLPLPRFVPCVPSSGPLLVF